MCKCSCASSCLVVIVQSYNAFLLYLWLYPIFNKTLQPAKKLLQNLYWAINLLDYDKYSLKRWLIGNLPKFSLIGIFFIKLDWKTLGLLLVLASPPHLPQYKLKPYKDLPKLFSNRFICLRDCNGYTFNTNLYILQQLRSFV